MVDLVAQKLSGSAGPGDTDLEALQGCLLKFWGDIKKLCISVESFVGFLEHKNPPWADYWSFMAGRLIALGNKPGLRPVGIGETWRQLFAKCVLKITGP